MKMLSMSKMSKKQIQFIQLVTALIYITFIIMSQSGNSTPDFVRGIVAGMSMVGSMFILLNFKLLKAAMGTKS